MLSWNKSYCWDGNKSLWSRALLAAFFFPLYRDISLPFSWMVIFSLHLPSTQISTCLQFCLTPAAYLYRQLWKANFRKSSCSHIWLGKTVLGAIRDTWILPFFKKLLAYSAQKYCVLQHPHQKNPQPLEKAPCRVQARALDVPWLACMTPKQPLHARQITRWGFQ